jgi:glycerophosphoryl diester phosphodiesterase
MVRPANPWLDRRVLAYAHQGGAREAPSSTLWAMEQALAAGADALELDVHATVDGHLVVCHDPTLDRTTDGAGPIAAHRLDELARLDAAYHFVPGVGARPGRPASAYPLRGRAPDDERFRVPTLESVLRRFPGVLLNLDVKQRPPQVPAYEHHLVDLLQAHGRTHDVIVAAFDERSTAVVASLAPEIPLSPGRRGVAAFAAALRLRRPVPSRLRRYAALQLPVRVAGRPFLTPRLVEAAHAAGLAVHAWTVDEPGEIRRLVGLGVDGVMSDRPGVLAGVLAEAGASWRSGSAA